MKTDTERVGWSRRYRLAMSRYLRDGEEHSASFLPATRLGRQAVVLGLETLDVARVHVQTLASETFAGLGKSDRFNDVDPAKNFFTEVIIPIEETHRAAKKAGTRIDQLTRDLRERTRVLSSSSQRLTRAMAQRQTVEVARVGMVARQAKQLAEAERLQKRLQHQARVFLMAQEHERNTTARKLRNEIAQSLIAVDLSLLALKASADTIEQFENEVANTYRLLGLSLKGSASKGR